MADIHTSGGLAATEEAPEAGGGIDRVLERINAASRHIALLAAWIATCGSLFLSEVLGWIPCELCWFQRILMYPLSVILLVGILRRDRGVHLYALPLALVGACVSTYHYLLIKTDWLPPPACSGGVPCNVDYIDILGFINIPLMALTAFLIIIFMMVGSTMIPEHGEAEVAAQPARSLDASRVAALAIVGVVVGAYVVLAQL